MRVDFNLLMNNEHRLWFLHFGQCLFLKILLDIRVSRRHEKLPHAFDFGHYHHSALTAEHKNAVWLGTHVVFHIYPHTHKVWNTEMKWNNARQEMKTIRCKININDCCVYARVNECALYIIYEVLWFDTVKEKNHKIICLYFLYYSI